MDWTWLLLLACPLMMLPMMFMMKGNHSDSDHSGEHNKSSEMNDLKEQNSLLQKELQQLKKEKG